MAIQCCHLWYIIYGGLICWENSLVLFVCKWSPFEDLGDWFLLQFGMRANGMAVWRIRHPILHLLDSLIVHYWKAWWLCLRLAYPLLFSILCFGFEKFPTYPSKCLFFMVCGVCLNCGMFQLFTNGIFSNYMHMCSSYAYCEQNL